MALVNPEDKALVESMGADDTFVVVTAGGATKRIKKSDIAQAPEVITDTYENAKGELVLVIGDGGEENP